MLKFGLLKHKMLSLLKSYERGIQKLLVSLEQIFLNECELYSAMAPLVSAVKKHR